MMIGYLGFLGGLGERPIADEATEEYTQSEGSHMKQGPTLAEDLLGLCRTRPRAGSLMV